MKIDSVRRFRPAFERLEEREVPAFLNPISSSGGGRAVATGDLNHDGRADIAVIGDNNSVAVSLSNGDGTFRRADTLSGSGVRGYYLNGFRMADVNADGHLDVVVDGLSKQYKTVSENLGWTTAYWYTAYSNVWLGTGDGTLGQRSTTSDAVKLYSRVIGDSIASYVLSDVNRDGLLDFVGVEPTDGAIVVLVRNADGTYQSRLTFAAGSLPGTLAVGDFDGDGWTDIVVGNNLSSSSPSLSVLLNDRVW